MSKKIKNEAGLLREALRVIMNDAVRRRIAEFEATDSHNLKIEYAYRLLVHDKTIIPLPPGQITLPNMKHRLAMWVSHKLPADTTAKADNTVRAFISRSHSAGSEDISRLATRPSAKRIDRRCAIMR